MLRKFYLILFVGDDTIEIDEKTLQLALESWFGFHRKIKLKLKPDKSNNS